MSHFCGPRKEFPYEIVYFMLGTMHVTFPPSYMILSQTMHPEYRSVLRRNVTNILLLYCLLNAQNAITFTFPVELTSNFLHDIMWELIVYI